MLKRNSDSGGRKTPSGSSRSASIAPKGQNISEKGGDGCALGKISGLPQMKPQLKVASSYNNFRSAFVWFFVLRGFIVSVTGYECPVFGDLNFELSNKFMYPY